MIRWMQIKPRAPWSGFTTSMANETLEKGEEFSKSDQAKNQIPETELIQSCTIYSVVKALKIWQMGKMYIWIVSQWNHKEIGLLPGWSLRFTAFGNTEVEGRQDKYWRWHWQPIKVLQSAWLWSIIYDLTWKLWVGGKGPCLKGLNMRDEGLETEGEVRWFPKWGHKSCFPVTSSRLSQRLEYVTNLVKLLEIIW